MSSSQTDDKVDDSIPEETDACSLTLTELLQRMSNRYKTFRAQTISMSSSKIDDSCDIQFASVDSAEPKTPGQAQTISMSSSQTDDKEDVSISEEADASSLTLAEPLQRMSKRYKTFRAQTINMSTSKLGDSCDMQFASVDSAELKTPGQAQTISMSSSQTGDKVDDSIPEETDACSLTLTELLQRMSNRYKTFSAQTINMSTSKIDDSCDMQFASVDSAESKTPGQEELMQLKGIGEKRSTFILEVRKESPKPFKEECSSKE